jgi:hypothetical protein
MGRRPGHGSRRRGHPEGGPAGVLSCRDYFVRRPRIPALGLIVAAGLATHSFAGDAMSAQATVDMGNAASFGALSAAGTTNAGQDTVVHGNIGSSTSIDAGVTHPGFAAYGPGSPQLAQAQASLLIAYGDAEAQTPTQSITGQNLAGVTLGPGVYNSTSDILISGPTALTLNGHGNPRAVFIFQAASSGNLTVDPTSSVSYTNGAQPATCSGRSTRRSSRTPAKPSSGRFSP